ELGCDVEGQIPVRRQKGPARPSPQVGVVLAAEAYRRHAADGAHGHPPSGSPTSVEAVSKPSSTLRDALTAVPVRGWRPPEGKCRVSKGLSIRANGPGPCARTGHGASPLDPTPLDRHTSLFCFDFRPLIVSKGRSTLFRHF